MTTKLVTKVVNRTALTHKVRAYCLLDVPKFGAESGRESESVTVEPKLISSRLVRNSHLEADELYITVGLDMAGADPRTLKQGRVLFWIWDDSIEDRDPAKPSFVGIVDEVTRRQTDSTTEVEIKALDYTTLFLENNLPAAGVPDWSNTLSEAWWRICDFTGFYDPDQATIVSSVADLRNRLVFRCDPSVAERTIGEVVPQRFHAISKPTTRGNPWSVWQYIVNAMSLISFIEGDQCIVTDAANHFGENQTPVLMRGLNVSTIEEKALARTASRGILLKSVSTLTGEVLEAIYPPVPDPPNASTADPRVTTKTRRATANVKYKPSSFNDVAAQYTEQFVPWIQTLGALEAYAQHVYEQWSRQELEGRLTTAAVELEVPGGATGDQAGFWASVFDLGAGDPVRVVFSDVDPDLLSSKAPDDQRVYLLKNGYSEDMINLLIQNMAGMASLSAVFNVRGVTIELGPEKFEVEIRYWAKIRA